MAALLFAVGLVCSLYYPAALPFPSASVAVSPAHRSSTYYRRLQPQSALHAAALSVAVGFSCSPHCPRQLFLFRRLQPTVESPPLLWGFSPLFPVPGRIIFPEIPYFCCKQDSIDNRYRSQIRGKPLQGAPELRGSDFLPSQGKATGKRSGNHQPGCRWR